MLGDARGRWEGDTLVVETTSFSDTRHFLWRATWRAARPSLHLVERVTRLDDETIDYQFTMTDPEMFTHPWTADVPMTTNQATIGRIRPPIVGGFGPDATFQADDAASVGVTFDGVAEAHLYGADVRATGVRRDRRQRRGRRPQSGARVPAGSREPRWGAPGVPGCGPPRLGGRPPQSTGVVRHSGDR